MSQHEPHVRRVVEVNPTIHYGDRSSDVNDYLLRGWVLLNTGTVAAPGDSSTVYYSVGWKGVEEPVLPPWVDSERARYKGREFLLRDYRPPEAQSDTPTGGASEDLALRQKSNTSPPPSGPPR